MWLQLVKLTNFRCTVLRANVDARKLYSTLICKICASSTTLKIAIL